MKASASTRKLTTMAMLTAISIVLVAIIHFPLFPAAPWMEYDPADIPIFIGTFLFGPLSGLCLTLVVSVIQGLTVSAASGPIGILMHFCATGSFVLVAGNLYKRSHTRKGAVTALVCGIGAWTLAMVLWNLIFTPIFMGAPMEAVLEIMIPVIIPFNLVKAGINAVVTYLVYKPIARLVRHEHFEAAPQNP
ncbi:ECF transporter S component [Anaerotruncus rubiinfantis]|uniref:ECF transporter S component n=1 Tax=Anaerotruncus rubiinfantis TaxID=1720200 RepID=UPI000837580C|nr:ECF transporter S component [Anaerotruncus rubiinfantis]